MAKVPEPQLHSPRERWALMACTEAVPRNGVILEVGTGGGGTTHLLRNHADPSVSLTTLDVDQHLLQAQTTFAGRDITFLDGTSDVLAKDWSTPIDFLLIDGGHRLCDTMVDVTAWFPHLAPGARVAFHDYDEPLAGGIYYLGVKIVVDTLLRLGILAQPEQHLTLLTTTLATSHPTAVISASDLLDTLREHARLVTRVRDYFTPSLLDWLLTEEPGSCREVVEGGPVVRSERWDSQQHPISARLNFLLMVYLFEWWMKEAAVRAMEEGSPIGTYQTRAEALTPVTEVSLFVEMMRWTDAERRRPYPRVYPLETIASRAFYPDSLAAYTLSTVEEISRFVTLEQVRLNMMSIVTNPIFDRVVRGYDE